MPPGAATRRPSSNSAIARAMSPAVSHSGPRMSANAAGAACVRKVGASNALPTRAEIEELYGEPR